MATVSRLVFGDQGKITGYASVNFNGYFLGNPVTGTYELKSDCSFVYKLQDTSGAFQHFAGTLRPGGNEAQIRQTNPATGEKGAFKRLANGCQNGTLHGSFVMSTVSLPTPFAGTSVLPAGVYTAVVVADGSGNLKLARGADESTGTYKVDADCFVMVEYSFPAKISLRGIIVNEGREILAIETDPAKVAAVKFTAQ